MGKVSIISFGCAIILPILLLVACPQRAMKTPPIPQDQKMQHASGKIVADGSLLTLKTGSRYIGFFCGFQRGRTPNRYFCWSKNGIDGLVGHDVDVSFWTPNPTFPPFLMSLTDSTTGRTVVTYQIQAAKYDYIRSHGGAWGF